MSAFTEQDHARLATLFNGVTREDAGGALYLPMGGAEPYDGYKPAVREAPNGDTKACPHCTAGVESVGMNAFNPSGLRTCNTCQGTGRVPNVDAGPAAKRYLHVAPKYNAPAWAMEYYDRAFAESCRVATALGVPAAYRPHEAYGALRVLEYPSAAHRYQAERDSTGAKTGRESCTVCGVTGGAALSSLCPALTPGAGTVEHTDPDLFTLNLWRSTPRDLEIGEGGFEQELAIDKWVSPSVHIGEIGELVGLGPATPHRVPARPYVQKSLIYFAIPDHAARLPAHSGGWCDGERTVGEWLKERMDRSRYEAQP